ncbi:hypothetical protein CBFG_04673 [Clostridiales bacterium 1_7_47FAA]|nr:hypothetical protein CBFG_04673 [Clostridiales bacterium 1_7_47FAA]
MVLLFLYIMINFICFCCAPCTKFLSRNEFEGNVFEKFSPSAVHPTLWEIRF